MTDNVLTTAAVVSCGHDPSTVTLAGSAVLTVNDVPVLTADGVSTWAVTVCAAAGQNFTKCTKVSALTAGESGVLSVGGQAVLTSTLAGATNGVIEGVPQASLSGSEPNPLLTVGSAP
jgi:hypothetical protein